MPDVSPTSLDVLGDSPNYPDHDFPQGSGYLITPCGYMLLEKETDLPSTSHYDLDCIHNNTPRTGPLHIINRSQKYSIKNLQSKNMSTTSSPIIQGCTDRNKTGIILLVNGGPDWSDVSWTGLLYLLRPITLV